MLSMEGSRCPSRCSAERLDSSEDDGGAESLWHAVCPLPSS